MKLEVKVVDNKTIWDDFVRSFVHNSFLQSWDWGEFARKQNHAVFRFGLYDNDRLVGANQLVMVKSKRATYLESHGGLMILDNSDYFNYFHKYLINFAKEKQVHFLRIRPPHFYNDELVSEYKKIGYRFAPMYLQAEYTLLLDLTKSEEDLLKGMRKQTRYYVKKAQTSGVSVEVSSKREDVSRFFQLYEKTVERQHFVPYGLTFFEHEFDALCSDNAIEIFFGMHDGKAISTAMVVYYGDKAYYHHGGSIRTNPDLFAPYLVQWEIIKRVKKKGYKTYDFFGVAPTDDPTHPRAGLTTFKRGFGGERVHYINTLDYPINKLRYWVVYLFVKLERWKKGL